MATPMTSEAGAAICEGEKARLTMIQSNEDLTATNAALG